MLDPNVVDYGWVIDEMVHGATYKTDITYEALSMTWGDPRPLPPKGEMDEYWKTIIVPRENTPPPPTFESDVIVALTGTPPEQAEAKNRLKARGR